MRFLRHDNPDPHVNLALEEILLSSGADDIFMLWQNSPSVIIGRNQDVAAEVDCNFARAHGIKVVRRITGGGAVYHDWGNLNFSLITRAGTSSLECIRPLLHCLREFELSVAWSGRNDILIAGKKISGTAQCLTGGRLLFHGTLLINSRLEVFDSILKPSTDKLARHSVDSVRSRVGNLVDFLKDSFTASEFTLALMQKLLNYFNQPCCGSVFAEEWAAAIQLAENKYRRPDWTWKPQAGNREKSVYEL